MLKAGLRAAAGGGRPRRNGPCLLRTEISAEMDCQLSDSTIDKGSAATGGQSILDRVLNCPALITLGLFTFVVAHVLFSTRARIPTALAVIAAVCVPTVIV